MDQFKFQIGDHVLPSVVVESIMKTVECTDELRMPDAYRVAMRCSEECVAGVQRFYKLFTWDGRLITQPEEALMPINEVYDKWYALYTARRERQKGATT